MMRRYAQQYPCVESESFSTWFEPGSDYVLTDSAFEQLLALARNESSPGMPLMYVRRLNKDVKLVPTELKALVENRIRKLMTLTKDIDDVTTDYVDPSEGAWLVDEDLADPVRLVCKNEPQKTSKETRNVASVSLVDSMVDSIVNYHQMQCEIEAVQEGYATKGHWPHPSTVGLDLETPENLEHLLQRFALELRYEESQGSCMADSDVRGYEYSVSVAAHRLYQAWHVAMRNRAGGAQPWWWRLFRARNWVLLHPCLASSDGHLFTLAIAIMLSGSKTTAHKNSVIRALLPTIVDVRFKGAFKRILTADVNGDDANEATGGKDASTIMAGYLDLGFLMTDFHLQTRPLEVRFCSWVHREIAPRPEGYGKSLMKLLSKKVLPYEEYVQFHQRYVVTGVVDFRKLFPLVAPVIEETSLLRLAEEYAFSEELTGWAKACFTSAKQNFVLKQNGESEDDGPQGQED